MLLYEIKNYLDQEKLDLVNDYIDFKNLWECRVASYDFFLELEKNKRQLWRFLKFTVPACFDNLDYEVILWPVLKEIQDKIEKIAYEFPSFYMQSALVGALHCYWEHLSVKKIISRWSQILLGIF